MNCEFNKKSYLQKAIIKGVIAFVLFMLICILAKSKVLSPLVVAIFGILVPFIGYHMVMNDLIEHDKNVKTL